MRKAIKEIGLLLIAVIMLFGGLGIFLTNPGVNGVSIIAILIMGAGGAMLAYVLKTEKGR